MEGCEEELTMIMEGYDGKLSKAPVPKKSRPTPDIPEIKLPFPPLITARDIFEKIFSKKSKQIIKFCMEKGSK